MKKSFIFLTFLFIGLSSYASTRYLTIVNHTQSNLSFITVKGDSTTYVCMTSYTKSFSVPMNSTKQIYVTWDENCPIYIYDYSGYNIKSSIYWEGKATIGIELRHPFIVSMAAEIAPPWDGGMLPDPNVLPYSYSFIDAYQLYQADKGVEILNDRQTITINYNPPK